MRKLSQRTAPLLFAASLGFAPCLCADKLTNLGQRPDWSTLDNYQQTITREAFLERLDQLYAPNNTWQDTITLEDNRALILTREGEPPFVLVFADNEITAAPVPRRWRKPQELFSDQPNPEKPLAGYHIALDPGHIGGDYGPMEGRSWQIGDGPTIQEGDIVLEIAQLLKTRLESDGAQVTLVRETNAPITTETPESLRDEAMTWLNAKLRETHPNQALLPSQEAIQQRSELLFYRVSEIRARAAIVNEAIQPDLVLCLHLNAEDFADYANPQPVEPNHLHLLVNGAYGADELVYDDIRYGMLIKLLNDSSEVEVAVAGNLAATMAEATNLPPYTYSGPNAIAISGQSYVWGRNLLANRLYACPVVFLEPYVANSQAVYPRLVAQVNGAIGGEPSIYDEYVESVRAGLLKMAKSVPNN